MQDALYIMISCMGTIRWCHSLMRRAELAF